MSNRLSKASASSVKLAQDKANKSFAASSHDIVAPQQLPLQSNNAPLQHFSILTPRQIFAIPVHDASLPPSPDYLDCGNLQYIRNSTPPTPDSTTDIDMLISFLQSDAIHDRGYTWGDATEVLRWLFVELTNRLNHFLDLKVAELPEGYEPPKLLRHMKGVSKDIRDLVKWSRSRTHRQEHVDFRAFDEDVKRWKLIDTSRDLGIHDLVVLISEAKYRANFPGRGWIGLENLKAVAPPGCRPLARKRGVENNASILETYLESDQVTYGSQGFSRTRSEASPNTLPNNYRPTIPKPKSRKSQIQVFKDSSDQVQSLDSVPRAEKNTASNNMASYRVQYQPKGFAQPREQTSIMENMGSFNPYFNSIEPIGQSGSSNKRKRSAASPDPTSKRQKAQPDSRIENSLPSNPRFLVEQDSPLAQENLAHESHYGSFSSFESYSQSPSNK